MSENNSFDLMSLAPDEDMAENGVWVKFFEESELKIAQAQNKKYQRYLANQYRIHRRKIDLENEAADKLSEEITIKALAKYVLIDWKNITLNGTPNIPYTVELGIAAMSSAPVLKKEVEDQANRLQNFQNHEDETDVENVKPLSPGNLSGEAQSV